MARAFTTHLRSLGPGHPIAIATADCLLSKRFTTPTEALLRHRGEDVIAIVDETAAKTGEHPQLGDLAAWTDSPRPNVPIVRTISDIDGNPPALVFGLEFSRPVKLKDQHQNALIDAARAGVTVFHGLREEIADPDADVDTDSRIVALRTAGHLLDTRPTGDAGGDARACRVITLSNAPEGAPSTDAAASLDASLRALGATSDWLPTTWLGMAIRGAGREMSMLQAGTATESYDRAVRELEASAEIIVVDGGSGLTAPLLPASTAAAISGTRAAFHVICHTPTDREIDHDLRHAVDRAAAQHAAAGARSTLAGTVIDVSRLDQAEASRALEAGWALGAPCIESHADGTPIAKHLLSLARLRSTESRP